MLDSGIGKLLEGSPAMKVLVVGHTDKVGTFVFNTDLS
jgi:outer membrane protein OmpA-like peptidoglycan-associated protein